jgi:hypothetical protein
MLADLNWIYAHLVGEMAPKTLPQSDRIGFLTDLYQLSNTDITVILAEAPKSQNVIIHTQSITSNTINNATEMMTLEELKDALLATFLASKEPGSV